jgi:hypothetical protein
MTDARSRTVPAAIDRTILVHRQLEFHGPRVGESVRASCHSDRGIAPRRLSALVPIPKLEGRQSALWRTTAFSVLAPESVLGSLLRVALLLRSVHCPLEYPLGRQAITFAAARFCFRRARASSSFESHRHNVVIEHHEGEAAVPLQVTQQFETLRSGDLLDDHSQTSLGVGWPPYTAATDWEVRRTAETCNF